MNENDDVNNILNPTDIYFNYTDLGPVNIKHMYIKEGVQILYSDLFNNKNFSNLESITLPITLETIMKRALSNNGGKLGSLTSIIIKNLYRIDSQGFQRASIIQHISLPDSLTYIGSYGFRYCSNLTSITIPKNVEYIGFPPEVKRSPSLKNVLETLLITRLFGYHKITFRG